MVTNRNRKIRIAHIITRMDRGGAPDIVRLLCQRLDKALFDVVLIYGDTQNPSLASQELIRDLKEKAIPVFSLRRNIHPFYDMAAFFKLWMLLRRKRFDVVHAHTAKAGVLGRMAAKLTGVPVIIYSPHGHAFYGYFSAFASWLVVLAERFAALFCHKIHALTALEQRDLVSFHVCPKEKIDVIYSGVELGSLRKAAEEAGRIREQLLKKESAKLVGVAGRLEPVKGVDVFIDAAAMILEKVDCVKFLVIGDGSLRQGLEERVKDLDLAEKIIFTGWVEDAVPMISALDILVLPSLNEAVGRSLLEAQAVGVPVVATRVGGVPEVIEEGRTGLLVEPKDAQALKNAIVSLLEDDEKRKAMAERARGWMDARFSDTLMVEKFAQLYRSLAKKNEK